ncbi:uncharacterized protein A4U43_C01F730 [Asparagus officinalis]|uniref:Diacylglycerol kinase n=2 Tax=Asparagus officinalis TaxID=4686 RepID=A0A5P1FMD1_ASPOF|nr:uncharacterized protein A4U43_C01F730 [Asparagus officinalis]
MAAAMENKDPSVEGLEKGEGDEDEEIPEVPMVVFINPRSGGRQGTALKAKLLEFMGEEQVLDLTVTKPPDFFQYGLACLENLASLGDDCAKSVRESLRIMVAGGDGTVGWVLGSAGELHLQNRLPVPPTGIIPLGTGNDLSRTFGWGGSFPFAWKSIIKRVLLRAATGTTSHLDSWHVTVSTPDGETLELPHALRRMDQCPFVQDGATVGGELVERSCFEGVFYNYFSIGMDAQVAYGFHQLRDEKPHLAQNAIANKLIYTGYSCTQGWFLVPCMSDPSLRGLKNILRIYIRRNDSSDWEFLPVPSSIRAVVALNLQNYGSGRNPWGQLKPEYMEKRGFTEAHSDDGLIEIFGLKQGWHATFVMAELINAKHIAQAVAIRLEIRGGEWNEAFLQMDGEPWKQPLNDEYSTFVEIVRVPSQSAMIDGE